MDLLTYKSNKKTLLIGILNSTPDSFSDGGDYYEDTEKAVARAKQMISEGADIIDVGGESTRPGSEKIDAAEEIRRTVPVIKAIKKHIPHALISIDTWKSEVARQAMTSGCHMINSLGGFTFDKQLATVASEFQCPTLIYHIKGEPKSMQQGKITYSDVTSEIADFFTDQIAIGTKSGMKKDQFILDPGIGFGKSIDQNIEIINRLEEFTSFHLPITIGVSRKSHLGALLQKELRLENIPSPFERLEASLAETAAAVLNGASIIRTHDVQETKKFLVVLDKFKN
jgi:dihydropteroate synthase